MLIEYAHIMCTPSDHNNIIVTTILHSSTSTEPYILQLSVKSDTNMHTIDWEYKT